LAGAVAGGELSAGAGCEFEGVVVVGVVAGVVEVGAA
jgi:hypothetical protein